KATFRFSPRLHFTTDIRLHTNTAVMKHGKLSYLIKPMIIIAGAMLVTPAVAQDDDRDLRPARSAFESIWHIDNQTVLVPIKGTFELDFSHRFGTLDNGYDDFFGIAAPSNIRIGLEYVPLDNLMIGFGITKERKIWDFWAKYALTTQKRSGGAPVSVSYLVNMGWDTRDADLFEETTDRFAFFHQVMIARNFSRKVAVQLAPSLSYFNDPVIEIDGEGVETGRMENMHFALAALGKWKITPGTAVLLNVDVPLTSHEINDPEPNISFGLEFVTSSHAFQVFIGNYKSLVPQYNQVLNQNSFGDGNILIGFNMTRLWNF
ncbi:MAG: DUF5777 family beta-barrel protein, partial [Saprospiraceae bacterium]|nr:DUF5777 family beta-barrel protein [Saprospiraceae bacterium]